MIDLNEKKYLTNQITKEDILKQYTEYEIFKYYVGDFEVGQNIRSPLRKDDSCPSFNIFYSKRYNCLLFKDFAGKRGDFVIFVQELLHIPTYGEALQKIAYDMGMSNNNTLTKDVIIHPTDFRYSIEICIRPWEKRDILYWNIYNISLSTLKRFNVVPIKGYYHNQFYVPTRDISYAYLEYKDDRLTYKIYRPTVDKDYKWRNNNPYGVHQGYRLLPKEGKLLIITKSLKDVMSLYETMNIPAIGVQSEKSFIKDTVVEEYKNRFKHVIVLFDNDITGIEQAKEYKRMYNINNITIPFEYNSKDFSDLIKNTGKINASKPLKNLLLWVI